MAKHNPAFLKIVDDARSRVRECNVQDVKQKLDRGERFHLIDVREESEWAAGHLPEAKHIPLQQVPARLAEIPKDAEVVMVCRSGGRSGRAQQFLMSNGYKRVKNLTGGMLGWKRDVDPAMTVK